MTIDLSCLDWEQRIRAGQSLIPAAAIGINPDEAKRAVGIFNLLRLPDVVGVPPLSEACGDWFREIVGAFLGSIDPDSRKRVIRELFALVPKKNGKTSYGAGLMLTALLMNKRPRAEFLLIGPTQAVSDLAFDQAAGMIENDPEGFLQKRMHIKAHLKTITDRRTKADLKIKTFDSKVLTGVKPAGVLLDELHEIAKNARASKVVGQIRGGILPNPEGFLAIISTQSDEAPSGVFKDELATARAIRDGKAQGAMLPVLYEFPKDIAEDKSFPRAWQNPEHWPMVLPNLGRSITLERLIEDYETAQTKGEAEIRRWASQHLNIQIGLSLSDGWAGAEYWEQNADPTLTLDTIIARSEVVVIGIDGGGLEDLLGLAVMGRDRETKQYLVWCHAWVHRRVIERRKDIAARLLDFERDGDLTIYDEPGPAVIDVADIVMRVHASGLLSNKNCIGVDQVGITAIQNAILARGISVECFAGIGQGWKLNNSIEDTGLELAAGNIKHADQPLMNWCLGNAKAETRGNAVLIVKEASGRGKIDPLIALFDAVAVMRHHLSPAPQYEAFFLG